MYVILVVLSEVTRSDHIRSSWYFPNSSDVYVLLPLTKRCTASTQNFPKVATCDTCDSDLQSDSKRPRSLYDLLDQFAR